MHAACFIPASRATPYQFVVIDTEVFYIILHLPHTKTFARKKRFRKEECGISNARR
jgi:hypothetical protein